MTDPKPVQLDVWSDIACPWCWVGKRNLETALANFEGPVRVIWRSFELNPSAPTEPEGPVDYAERLGKKYGVDREEAEGFIERMVTAGRNVGLDLRFDRIRPSNTFNAHRLLLWARQHGQQEPLGEALFRAYLHEGSSLNDQDTLTSAAQSVGLDSSEAAGILHSAVFAEDVRAEQEHARKIGVTGVPFYLLDSQLAVQGAQPAETLGRALDQARSGAD